MLDRSLSVSVCVCLAFSLDFSDMSGQPLLMTKAMKAFRRTFRRKLVSYVDKELTHCGHEVPLLEAEQERERLIDWASDELGKYESHALILSIKEREAR